MEREILRNLETIMDDGLPLDKIASFYKDTDNAAKQSLLDRYTFCEYMRNEVSILITDFPAIRVFHSSISRTVDDSASREITDFIMSQLLLYSTLSVNIDSRIS